MQPAHVAFELAPREKAAYMKRELGPGQSEEDGTTLGGALPASLRSWLRQVIFPSVLSTPTLPQQDRAHVMEEEVGDITFGPAWLIGCVAQHPLPPEHPQGTLIKLGHEHHVFLPHARTYVINICFVAHVRC